jgi:hypothetical protein
LDRDVVAATGPEAGTFLQGQLSQDVLALGDGTSAWSWVLAPTGKVDALVRVTRLSADDWLLDTDGGWGEALVTRLNRFKLRTKVELAKRSWPVLGLRGEQADAHGLGESVTVKPPWPGLNGLDVLTSAPVVPDGLPVMSAEEYEAERIAAGIPKMGAELTEELVARIDSRGGNVPRHLRGVVLPERVERGTELLDAEGRAAGTLTSVGHSPRRGWVGLGYVRRGVDVPGRLQAGPGGPEVEVRELRR